MEGVKAQENYLAAREADLAIDPDGEVTDAQEDIAPCDDSMILD